MSDFNYEIVEKIAILSKKGNLTKELNLISYNGNEPKFDIRTWREEYGDRKMGKGVTLSAEEMQSLRQAIAER